MKPVTEDFGVLFFQMKTTWGSWSIEPEGCILLLPLLRSQCNFFRRFLQKCRFSSVGTVIVCALQWELYLAVTDSALPPILGHTIQPATRQLSCSGAFLEEKKKKKGGGGWGGGRWQRLLFPSLSSMPSSRPVFKHGIFKSFVLLYFTFNITPSQVRPMPRAVGNLILIFFCCCGFMGRSRGHAQVWAGCL